MVGICVPQGVKVLPKGNRKVFLSFVQGAAHGNRAIAKKRRVAPKVAAPLTAVNDHDNTQLSVNATNDWQPAVQTNRLDEIVMELNEIDDLLSKLN